MKYEKLVVTFRIPQFGLVNCLVAVRDEYAVSTFKNIKHAKDLYEAERKSGLDVRLILRLKAVVQKYEGKTKEEILGIIKTELKKAGGKYTTQKVNIPKKVAG